MLVASSVMLRPLIEKQNQRPLLFQTSLGFSIGGASLYFYTGSAEKYHAGPHFSMEVTRPFSVWSSQCSLSWHLLVPTVHAELEVPQPTYHDEWCVFGAQCMRRDRAQHVEREVGHPSTASATTYLRSSSRCATSLHPREILFKRLPPPSPINEKKNNQHCCGPALATQSNRWCLGCALGAR